MSRNHALAEMGVPLTTGKRRALTEESATGLHVNDLTNTRYLVVMTAEAMGMTTCEAKANREQSVRARKFPAFSNSLCDWSINNP